MTEQDQRESFKQAVCRTCKLTEAQFEKHILLQCAYPSAKAHFWLASTLKHNTLNSERELIRDLEMKQSVEEVTKTIEGPTFLNYLGEIPKYRRKCKIRLSGSLIVRLAEKSFKST